MAKDRARGTAFLPYLASEKHQVRHRMLHLMDLNKIYYMIVIGLSSVSGEHVALQRK